MIKLDCFKCKSACPVFRTQIGCVIEIWVRKPSYCQGTLVLLTKSIKSNTKLNLIVTSQSFTVRRQQLNLKRQGIIYVVTHLYLKVS